VHGTPVEPFAVDQYIIRTAGIDAGQDVLGLTATA
jgi:hypothetical protein